MLSKNEEYFPAVINVIAALVIMVISFSSYFKFSVPLFNTKLAGIIIVYIGIGIIVWASLYLKRAILGMIHPRLDHLVKNGPYKYCRHPVYLGITISFIGLTLALRSWLGLIAVLLLFLPSEIHRAKLEEKVLFEKFGEIWTKYKNTTGFFIPIYRKK